MNNGYQEQLKGSSISSIYYVIFFIIMTQMVNKKKTRLKVQKKYDYFYY